VPPPSPLPVKKHLKPAIQAINRALLDTIAACGDVNRNVQCAANPSKSHLHKQVWQFSKDLSEHLLPDTSAYAEIWLDKKKVAGDAVQDFEPKYGKYYLPRKVSRYSLISFFFPSAVDR
jgi:sulfite reductase (NADPH) hemoprotein beta-component